MMWTPLLSLILMIFSHFGTPSTCKSTPSSSSSSSSSSLSSSLAPAMYVFGDSLVDNGNNNYMPTVARANYFPYGFNFNGGVTGRFSNGRTTVDFLAEYLGLPYAPPYTSIFGHKLPFNWGNVSVVSQISGTGYNYASAASGILPETGSHFGKCFTLDEQIDMFESTIRSQLSPSFKDPTKLAHHLAKSIFVVSVGSNDYINNYIDPLYIESKRYTPLQFAQLLADALSIKLQRLYDLGARKVLVSELGPLGCVPTVARRVKLKPTNKIESGYCDDEVNQMTSLFNTHLALVLKNLTSTLHNSYFILALAYSINYDAISNPLKYGLMESRHPCCTTWVKETYTCIPEIAPCSSPEKYFFWDGYHPTEAVFSFSVDSCIYGSSICLPINFHQLLQV